MNTILRSFAIPLLAALVLAPLAPHASAQVQVAAAGDATWAARSRAAGGNSVSILARVYVQPTATTGSLTIGVGGTGGGRHKLVVGSDLALSVASANSAGSARTTTYSTTNTEGRWVWYAAYIPSTVIGGGVGVTSSLWYDANGSWTAASGASTGADPGGTIADTAGTVAVTNGTNGSVVVGPLYVWAGADSPDAAAEFRAVALGSTAPDAYTGLVFSATCRDDLTDTFGTDVVGTGTSTTVLTQNGLPSWSGIRHHRLVDLDPSRETALGVAASITNYALTGGAFVAPAGMQGGEIVDTPYGVRAGYIGEDPAANNNAWEAPANGPIVHNRYSTVVIVGGACAGPGSTPWNLFASGATDLQIQLLGLGRFGYNANITDANHRATATPTVYVTRMDGATPVDHWYGNWGKVTHGGADPFWCGKSSNPIPSSSSMRIGAPTGSVTTLSRFWLQRLIVFEGVVVDADIDELISSLSGWHGCRNYASGVSRLLVAEGQSSMAGTWDYRAKMGALHRMAALAPRSTIVFNSATGTQTFVDHNADFSATVQYFSDTLCPGAVKKTFIGQMGSNDLDVASPDAAAVTTSMTNYVAAADPYYDRILLLKIAPRVALTASQANYAAAVTTFNGNLAGIAHVDRVFDSYFTSYGAGGDWSANPTHYAENPSGLHLNGAGHDLYMNTVWRGKAQAELGGGGRRRRM